MIASDTESDAEDVTGWIVEVSFANNELTERYFALFPSQSDAERAVADIISSSSSKECKAIMSIKRGQMNHLGLLPSSVEKCAT